MNIYCTCSYNLIDNGSGKFEIDSESGEIRAASPLDRETTAKYHLIVEAFDLDPSSPLSTRANITVDVIDSNDNAPQFIQSLYNVSVPDGLEAGL